MIQEEDPTMRIRLITVDSNLNERENNFKLRTQVSISEGVKKNRFKFQG